MKKLILLLSFILLTGIIFGQNLKPGNIIGFHHISDMYQLKPGITNEQLEDYYLNEYIPNSNKNYKGISYKLLKGVKGADARKLALLMVIESKAVFDKNFSEEAFANMSEERMKQMMESAKKMSELAEQTGEVITDWNVLNSEISVKEGNVLGFHMLSDMNELKPGVTLDKVEAFYNNKYIPAFNKGGKGMSAILVKGMKGTDAGKIALIIQLESVDALNSIFTEESKVKFADLSGLQEELSKLWTTTGEVITDWVVLN